MLPLPFGPHCFEQSGWETRMALRWLRGLNTGLDFAFYDVEKLIGRLASLDITFMHDDPQLRPLGVMDSLADPEGAILVVDAPKATITHFRDVGSFLTGLKGWKTLDTISISGIGSSALGSAALAWNVSTKLQKPVAAIVPGYGVADSIAQALGGWYCFGWHDTVRRLVQSMMGNIAQSWVGRGLWNSLPAASRSGNGGYERGSPEADILRHLMSNTGEQIKRLVGHSKGALAIGHMLDFDPPSRPEEVVTFGCAIPQTIHGVRYVQFLGDLDWLGKVNSWSNHANRPEPCGHTTNTLCPLCMNVERRLP